jgi:hypothetical protein
MSKIIISEAALEATGWNGIECDGEFQEWTRLNVRDFVIDTLEAAAPHIIADNAGTLPEGVRWHTRDYWNHKTFAHNLHDLLKWSDDFKIFEGMRPTQITDVFAFKCEDECYEFKTKKEALAKIAELKSLGVQDKPVI